MLLPDSREKLEKGESQVHTIPMFEKMMDLSHGWFNIGSLDIGAHQSQPSRYGYVSKTPLCAILRTGQNPGFKTWRKRYTLMSGPKGRNSLAQANGLGLQAITASCGLKGRVNVRPLSRTFSAGILPDRLPSPLGWADGTQPVGPPNNNPMIWKYDLTKEE